NIFLFIMLACNSRKSYLIENYYMNVIKSNKYCLIDISNYAKLFVVPTEIDIYYIGANLYDNRLFLYTMGGELYLLNIRDKTKKLIYEFNETMGHQSAIYNNIIILYSRNGILYFYDFIKNILKYKDDNVIAKIEINFNIIDNFLYFADDNMNILRYNLITNDKSTIYAVEKEIEDILYVANSILIRVYGKIFSYNIHNQKTNWEYIINEPTSINMLYEIKDELVLYDMTDIVTIDKMTGREKDRFKLKCENHKCKTFHLSSNLFIEDNKIIHIFSNGSFSPLFFSKNKFLTAILNNNILYVIFKDKIVGYDVSESKVDLSFYKNTTAPPASFFHYDE
ncbi:hypothetical protein KKD49_13485, partial [Myxococcota bacterium]|nr:hypothetical protein [Myxococcota bacterium]